MKGKELKKIKVSLVAFGDNWTPVVISELAIEIEDNGSYSELVRNVNNAMLAVRTQMDAIQRIGADEIVCRWKDQSAFTVGKAEEAARHAEGGEYWSAISRANKAESENECLKKQVQNLIDQLSRNIEQERKDGTL